MPTLSKTATREVNYRGVIMTTRRAARFAKLPWDLVYQRIVRLGWTPEQALTTPANVNKATADEMIDRVFGRLTVVNRLHYVDQNNRRTRYLCRCSCGKAIGATGRDLRAGDVQSCGCHRRERWIALGQEHGVKIGAGQEIDEAKRLRKSTTAARKKHWHKKHKGGKA